MTDTITPPDAGRIADTKTPQESVPNATAVLVIGILSIIFCWCFGLIGLILGIVGLILGSNSKKLYAEAPDRFTVSSYKNLNAGYICSLVGTILSGLYFLIIIISIIFGLAVGQSLLPFLPWEEIFRDF
jgi:hypothetical protein